MAIGRNIPQEQAMLSQLPDEMLERGLEATPGDSPFTQFLGAIEMTKRVKQRKSAANTLAGQGGQNGTVVGRMRQQGGQIGPPQMAPSFAHGGQVPGKPQSEYNFSQAGPGSDTFPRPQPSAPRPAPPGRDSMTTQHRTSPNTGGKVQQRQLALSRAPQSLADGGVVAPGQPDMHQRHKIQGPEAHYNSMQEHRQAVSELRQPAEQYSPQQYQPSYGIGGMVSAMSEIPGAMAQGQSPEEIFQMQMEAAGQTPTPGLAKGGRVPQIVPSYAEGTTGVLSPLEEENRRRAALGMPPIPGPADLPLSQDSEFDPEAYAEQSALIGGPEPTIAPPQGPQGPTAAQHFSGNARMEAEAIERARRAQPGYMPFNPALPPSSQEIVAAGGTDMMRQPISPHPRPFVGPQPGEGPQSFGQPEQVQQMQEALMEEKLTLDIDAANAEKIPETDEQRSARFTRATALATMAASFGRNASFFGGLTEGVEGAAQVMQSGDQGERTRTDDANALAGKAKTAGEMMNIRAQGLRNDLAQGVVGTQIKMTKLATESVHKDLENGVSEMPDTEEGMALLVQSKMVALFGQQMQEAPSPNQAVLDSKE
jgi:hypothetical protein